MIKVNRYSAEYIKEWDEFVENSKNGVFLFKRSYMDYHAERFFDHSLLFYEEQGLVALLPANQRNDELYSHEGLTFGGLVTNQTMKTPKILSVFEALKEYCLNNGIKSCSYKAIPYVYNILPAQEDIYAIFRYKGKFVRSDVASVIDYSNMINYSERRKRGIKKASNHNLFISQSSDFKQYFQIVSDLLKAKYNATPVHIAEEMELLAKRFPQEIKLYIISKEDKMLAGVIIYEYTNVAHCQYIASTEEGKDLRALDLLFDYLIKTIFKHKRYFHFGTSNEDQGNYLNEGLISQKEEFGGRAVAHQFFKINF